MPRPQADSNHGSLAPPLPQNLDAERSVLGAILLDNAALEAAREQLTPGDFFSDHHRRIFTGMIELAEADQAIDLVTLSEQLRRQGELESAGGVAYIAQLVDGVPRVTHLEHYIRIIKEKSRARQGIHTLHAAEQQLLDAEADPDAILESARDSIAAIKDVRTAPTDAPTLVDMPEAVLDGRLGEISQRRLRGLPLAYSWPAILAAASVRVPPSSIRTNIFCALVGPVGSGKSQAIERALRALGVAEPEVQALMAGSGEGLVAKLGDAGGAPRLISVDELSHLLEKSKIKSASFPALLNRAYYQTEFSLTIAGGRALGVNCALGLIGGIVDANFQESFGSVTVFGLHDRFIFGHGPSPYAYSYRPFEGDPEAAVPAQIVIAPNVWEARDEWLKTIPAITGRHAEHALRCAVICAAWDRRHVLQAKDLGPARAFAEYQARVRVLLQPNPGENLDARCAFAITSALDGVGWTTRRGLYRKIHGSRYGPGAFDRALQSLEFNGEINSRAQGRQKLLHLAAHEL